MKERYRVENGKLAKGMPKHFSEEELQKRRDRIHLARASKAKKDALRKSKRLAFKQTLKIAAEAGVFIPVQDFE